VFRLVLLTRWICLLSSNREENASRLEQLGGSPLSHWCTTKDMLIRSKPGFAQRSLFFLAACTCMTLPLCRADAAACTTQSQMTPVFRDALAAASRTFAAQLQQGDILSLRANSTPEVAADFSGIASSISTLRPKIQAATVTVDELYGLDASAGTAANAEFFCGFPVVVLNLNALPPGNYALAILHATGVAQPQQLALVLSRAADNRWMLAGIFIRPLTENGHGGLWYWTMARQYAQTKRKWNAWLYYRVAADLLDPVDFLSSPNLQKLQHEMSDVHPEDLPAGGPVVLNGHGAQYQLTSIDTTTELGAFDLDVHYSPTSAQAAELRNGVTARAQVLDVMRSLLVLHPELGEAFHGFWVHADQGNASLFALELPVSGINGR